MGQVESGTAAAEDAAETTASSPSVSVANDNSSQSLPSLDSLIAGPFPLLSALFFSFLLSCSWI